MAVNAAIFSRKIRFIICDPECSPISYNKKMMVQIGKSQSLHEDLITPSKRLATGSPSVNRVIDLVNNQYESNMQRL